MGSLDSRLHPTDGARIPGSHPIWKCFQAAFVHVCRKGRMFHDLTTAENSILLKQQKKRTKNPHARPIQSLSPHFQRLRTGFPGKKNLPDVMQEAAAGTYGWGGGFPLPDWAFFKAAICKFEDIATLLEQACPCIRPHKRCSRILCRKTCECGRMATVSNIDLH